MPRVLELGNHPKSHARPVSLRHMRSYLERVARHSNRPLFAFAIDGIAYHLAAKHWKSALINRIRSETPTSSAACWLSSVTGLSPVEHGALGAVQRFEVEDSEARSVFARTGGLFGPGSTVFEDMRKLGRRAICCDADLRDLDGEWCDMLRRGAEFRATDPFYACTGSPNANIMIERISGYMESWLKEGPETFVWIFIDMDLHIHHHGYDDHVEHMLGSLDKLFGRFAPFADIVAYSDHGMVPTKHDPTIAALLQDFCYSHRLEMAGAGRMRWFYRVGPEQRAELMSELSMRLPSDISVHSREEIFPGFRYHPHYSHRVGDILLIAQSENFVTNLDYSYDHGGLSKTELFVPRALWRG